MLAYHLRQFDQPYRSTEHLTRFLGSLPLSGGNALDVACGAGANIAFFSSRLKGFRWTGLDIFGDDLFEHGQKRLVEQGLDVRLVTGDLFDLTLHFAPLSFELVTCVQTLSWIPDWRGALDQMLAVTKGWLVLSALFTDANVEVVNHVVDLTHPEMPPQDMGVLSLPRVRAHCEARGAIDFRSQEFAIDLDLTAPPDGLGTYTRKLEDGSRLQFTGPVYMPWRFVAIRSGAASSGGGR